jgi:spore coat polysaccharide biosynthesis predicted glycosyltransferase SpsG
MGHFYRGLNLITHLRQRSIPHIVLINDYPTACGLLRAGGIEFQIVPLADIVSNWEARLIERHRISVWTNDRLDTESAHAKHVKENGSKLVTFDDRGGGAAYADLHFAALAFEDRELLKGSKVFTGVDYLILNAEIDRYRHHRQHLDKIVVTMGGTDTYGVTIRVVEALKESESGATLVLGPGFQHDTALDEVLDGRFVVRRNVPSLIREFSEFSLAVTGGGITAFEAAASGLPCLIVANEMCEIPAARYLEDVGCAVFAGHHSHFDGGAFKRPLPIDAMSRAGLSHIRTGGLENVCRELLTL